MNIYPIFARELRCGNRRAILAQRFSVAWVTALAFLVVVVVDQWVGGINLARLTVLAPYAGLLPFLLLIVALNRAGNLFSAERREGTLPLLFLTHLTGFDIILGKLLQALLVELNLFLAAVPALVLPLIALGFSLNEAWLIGLGCLNVLFFGFALGLFGSVFGDGRIAASWCLLFLLPLLAYSTPLAFLLPAGQVRDLIAALQWLNPCDAPIRAQAAAAGLRPAMYWFSLLTNHAVAWCLLGLAGYLLPRVLRRQAAVAVRTRGKFEGKFWKNLRACPSSSYRSRARLLDRNPFLWLTSRSRWSRGQIWLWLMLPVVTWGTIAWHAWGCGLNLTLVMVIATSVTWFITIVALAPVQVTRQLVTDRLTGALEMLLCTPFTAHDLLRGAGLSVARRFLLPVAVVTILSVTLTAVGYLTFGFGGMIDPADRPFWLFSWFLGILLLPLSALSLYYVSLRLALSARDAGDAHGVALL